MRTAPLTALLIAIAFGSGCSDDHHHAAAPTATSTAAAATATRAVTATPTAVPVTTATAAPSATATINNAAPVIAPIGDQTILFGSERLLRVIASDPDGDPIELSVSPIPDNTYFLNESGVFCFNATLEEQIGHPLVVTFSATDGIATTMQTITIHVVRPNAEERAAQIAAEQIVLERIGNQTVRAGQTLMLQLVSHGPPGLTFRMLPDPALLPYITFDTATGRFTFAPPAALAERSFDVVFRTCLLQGDDCDPLMQAHERVNLAVLPAQVSCPDYLPASGCSELQPGALASDLPQPLESCYVIRKAGTYTFDYVNILDRGALYVVEDPAGTIDIRVKSLLVEKGGVLQAGSPSCLFGRDGGTLSVGIYGKDESELGTKKPAPVGIRCMTSPTDSHSGCFPEGRDPEKGDFYCTVSDSDDPCSSTIRPVQNSSNFLLEHYGNLNFDPTPWGYKTLGVSYGGSLRLFGWKGVQAAADDPLHCEVPAPEQSTLDAAEMRAWAGLTRESWARLDGAESAGTRTTLTLDRALPSWRVDDEILVGTTDWYPSHTEVRAIRAIENVTTADGPRTRVTVDALDYPHQTKLFDTEELASEHGADYTGPVTRKAADLRATVGLLTRSIDIHSLGDTADEPFPEVAECMFEDGPEQTCVNNTELCACGASSTTDPKCFFGAHLIFRQGFRDIQMQGVELRQLGQGGRIGHYPVHFHLAKSTAYTQGKAFLKDSSVWDSMTRFVTLHGSQNVSLLRNVGYLSVGHGYYLEDGSEIDNLLCHNLGAGARAALKEYYAEQKATAGERPPLTARYVPPILDGVSPSTSFQTGDPPRKVPLDPRGPTLRAGSDSYMPAMFWAMNAYNEFVGNAAVGVHGFGSCYWLLGSGLSGASAPGFSYSHAFSGLANYNLAGAYQAPLLRFRGNSCTTATYALPASAEISPAALCEAVNTGYRPMQNPYVYNADGTLKDVDSLFGEYTRPAVVGNFQPIEPNSRSSVCGSVATDEADLDHNATACVTTVLDRFTTSFNWAQVNYGSIWLRPWFYLLVNPAVTDQLFGGVTFVTSGSWVQVPPAYFSLAKSGLFVGSTQHGGSKYAQRSGPVFSVKATDDLTRYAPCAYLGNTTCNLPHEGVGLWTGGFQPKRLLNIYDGPHFADDNLFLNVGAWQCDPQPCLGKGAGECVLDLPCGIYTSSTQPAPAIPGSAGVDPHKMIVLDAAIGWKQPNGFYYPPAFTYRAARFFKTLPTGLPDPDPANPLNQCYSFNPGNDFMSPQFIPGDCRHNAVDRTSNYLAGNMLALNGGPTVFEPRLNQMPVSPIDFSTVIIDLDHSLTGASGQISGVADPVPTTSVSRNSFFDAPAQSDECLSFGVQTSPYQAVTTNVAPLAASPADGDTYIDPWTYETVDPKGNRTISATSPLLAIYRQWVTAKDPATCQQVCSTTTTDRYDCPRGTFMAGPNVGQATYLTLSQPPGLSDQPGAAYYIDTSTAAKQATGCVRAITGAMRPATFDPNRSYVVYNLFARNNAVSTYQLYVGDSISDDDLDAIRGRWVRITPHLTSTDNANNLSSFRSQVHRPCDPNGTDGWCAAMPKPTLKDGILTITIDQRPIAADFKASERPDYDRCIPRDVCYFDGTQCQPCADDPSKCIRQTDFLPTDIESMNHVDATGRKPLDVICNDWATYASGTTNDDLGEISLVDCPAGGCLGFAFTLPSDFVGDKTYEEKGAPLATCFDECAWQDDALIAATSGMTATPADPLCGEPRQQRPADYCSTGMCSMP